MPLLEIAGVTKRFGPVAAVDDVSLTIERGALFALLGPSGCGKTTLLRLVAGLERPDHGRIVIDGADVTSLPPYARPVNMMFQSYALFPHLDVAGNVAFGLRPERMDRRRRAARVAEMLALVQMSEFRARRPHELSGGQRQRVALARALAKMPKLLLLDEPLAALDRKLRSETRRELIGIQERVGTAFLIVTHDQEEALGMATRIAVMNRGRIAQIGAPAEIYERPQTRFVADFVGEMNWFEGSLAAAADGAAFAASGVALPIPLPSGAGAAVGPAALAVRPEKMVLSPVPPVGFAVPARVTAVDYQGGVSIIRLADRENRGLVAVVASAAARQFARGAAVWASWQPDDAVVIRR